jgi:hypothetical protein
LRNASCCYPTAEAEAEEAEAEEEEEEEEEASSQIMNEDLCAIFLGVPDGWPTSVRIECAP